jgi:6-phosphogluconolactonase
MELMVYETPEEVAIGAANRVAEIIASTPGRVSLGLAGGTSPVTTYQALRGRATGWDRVDAWLSDERWVAPDDERSNGKSAARALMDHVPASYIRPRWSEFMEPPDSAAHYEASLRSIHFQHRPDLILLGLGEDAHTASLFPGSEALAEESRWFVANEIPETAEPRLTSTFPLLWHAMRLLVITAGANKADAVSRAIAGDDEAPAARLDEGEAEVEWHLDQAAASLLP